MNIEQLVAQWLYRNGYDGFYRYRPNCHCDLTNLIHCKNYEHECLPGYLGKVIRSERNPQKHRLSEK